MPITKADSHAIFKNEEGTSYGKYSVIQKALIREVMKDVDEDTMNKALNIPSLQEKLKENLSILRRAARENLQGEEFTPVTDLMEKLEKPHFANLIIEEPELNLFPQTQVSLVYAMLREIDFDRDKVMITTHSPYTLYAINNCMLSHKVGDDMDNEDKQRLPSYASRLNPAKVSVWQTNDDGTLTNIKTSPLGLIGKHYFNEVMNDTLDEYHTMLDYTE